MTGRTKLPRLFDWLGSRDLVSWKEGVSYFLIIVMISVTFFFLKADIYPPVFGVVLLVVLISLGISLSFTGTEKLDSRKKRTRSSRSTRPNDATRTPHRGVARRRLLRDLRGGHTQPRQRWRRLPAPDRDQPPATTSHLAMALTSTTGVAAGDSCRFQKLAVTAGSDLKQSGLSAVARGDPAGSWQGLCGMRSKAPSIGREPARGSTPLTRSITPRLARAVSSCSATASCWWTARSLP
ncbi:hypothetical protein [Amycolatopsis sp. NPDC004079]|uniref:hypothetical protein n=1 Tax=Amycolatopsis sp. NPDC004079 TaxID=3154549 RepID=UPI0033B5CCA3